MDCPAGFLCINSQTIGLIVAIILLLIAFQTYNQKKDLANMNSIKEIKEDKIAILENRLEAVEKNNTDRLIVVPTQNSMLVNKDYERLINPLLPPERSYENLYRVPVNIPTRGWSENYQQFGVISQGDRILPIYGRNLWRGADKWNYYTSTDGFQSVKLPVFFKGRDCQDDTVGCDEILDGDSVQVPQYGQNGKAGDFKATVYKYDKPRYIPWVS